MLFNTYKSLLRFKLNATLISLFLAVSMILLSNSAAFAEDWFIGKEVGLCKGTHIYYGSSESYGYHTIVPENDWAVRIIGGPQGDWWDTSRKAAGDPSGGTGWVKKSEAESCKQSSPPPAAAPAYPQLTAGIALSKTQVSPGEPVDATFTVANNGQQDWRPQRLGVGVDGPSYLDFGWRDGLTVSGGQSYTFQGTIPNAPTVTGTYQVHVSWEDSSGNWNSLGGNAAFVVSSQSSSPSTSPSLTPSSPQLTGGIFLSRSEAKPGESVDGSFTVLNSGQQDWSPQRLGIASNGPSYLDFGWRDGLTIRSGETYSFQGTIPNAPDVSGTYILNASWEDAQGNWNSLGGTATLTIPSAANQSSEPQPGAVTDQSPPQPVQSQISFVADNYSVRAGGCTTLRWDVEGVRAVYLDGKGVNGHGTQFVCPISPTTYTLHILVDSGAIDKTLRISTTLDLDPSGVSGSSAQLTPEALAKAKSLFTEQNFDRLVDLVSLAVDGAQCLNDVVLTAYEMRQTGGLNPPLDMAEHCASAANDIYELIKKNYTELQASVSSGVTTATSFVNSDLVEYSLDCFPVIGGKGKAVTIVKGIGTGMDVKELLTSQDKIPSLVKVTLGLLPGTEPAGCIFSVGQNMQVQFWLENKASSGLWWLEGEFEKLWPAYNQAMNCLPLPSNNSSLCP